MAKKDPAEEWAENARRALKNGEALIQPFIVCHPRMVKTYEKLLRASRSRRRKGSK